MSDRLGTALEVMNVWIKDSFGDDVILMPMTPLPGSDHRYAHITTHAYVTVNLDRIEPLFDDGDETVRAINALSASLEAHMLIHAEGLERIAADIRRKIRR